MTSQNIIEKILAKHAGKDTVSPDEIISVNPDWIMANDATMRLNVDIVKNKIKAKSLANPNKVVLIMDHQVPSDSPQTAEVHQMSADFADEYNIPNFHPADGICHQILVEKYSSPGQLIVGADSHSPSSGCLGSFACGMGSTDICAAMYSGKTWLKVPQTIKIVLKGKLKKYVYAKDIILNVVKTVGAGGLIYKAVEFVADDMSDFSISQRFTLCNMTTEAGAKTGIIKPDQFVFDYIKQHRGIELNPKDYEYLYSDRTANYENVIEIDLDKLEPQIACPHSPDNVHDVNKVKGTRVDKAFLGACTNSRIDDLRIAADILKGKKVHKSVMFSVAPASRDIYSQAISEGLMNIFIDAGAVVNHPGCSTCWGASQGVVSSGQNLISTQNRNYRGRSGSKDANIYLASPLNVAISAITGEITDPNEYFG